MTALTCHTVSWRSAAKALCEVRRQVFIEEQHVPPELEWDDADHQANHFLLTSAAQTSRVPSGAIGCARVLREHCAGCTHFHVGRVAIVAPARQHGAGTYLMRELLRWCQQQTDYTHCNQVFLHAQCDVIPFYERLGFYAHGDVFMDAGIQHRAMIWQTSL